MKITIITVAYNSEDFLEEAIQSVVAQTYKNIEYIVIDGASTDNTLKIIEKYHKKGVISKFISEPDEGIYDAMNKGIEIASGDIVAFLNSDDFYISENVIENVVHSFHDTGCNVCYGDVVFISRENSKKVIRYWKTGKFDKRKLINGWQIPHPALFVRKDLVNKTGPYDLSYEIASDYDYMLKNLLAAKTVTYLPKPLVAMRWGGKSTSSVSNMIKGNGEIHSILRKYNLQPPPFPIFLLMRFSARFFQIMEGLMWKTKKH
jgi:glycosyltransferase